MAAAVASAQPLQNYRKRSRHQYHLAGNRSIVLLLPGVVTPPASVAAAGLWGISLSLPPAGAGLFRGHLQSRFDGLLFRLRAGFAAPAAAGTPKQLQPGDR